MIDLNELSKKTLEIGRKRIENGAKLYGDFLKHCAGEVVEADSARFVFYHLAYAEKTLGTDEETSEELRKKKQEYAHELADVIICILNESAKANIDIERAILEVVEKNQKRADGIGDKL